MTKNVKRNSDWLISQLGDDFKRFATEIKFSEDQITQFQNSFPGPEDYKRRLLEQWYETVGRHTTKYDHIIYTALEAIGRNDLTRQCFPEGVPEMPSEGIWGDFLGELQKIEVAQTPSCQSKDHISLERSSMSKKRKKKRTEKCRSDEEGLQKETESITVVNETYNLVGKNNTLTINYGNSSQPGVCPEYDVCLSLLTDIIHQSGSPGRQDKRRKGMNLQDLETCFERKMCKKFQHVTSKNLLTFLRQHNSVFSLQMHSRQWYVDMLVHEPSFESAAKHISKKSSQDESLGDIRGPRQTHSNEKTTTFVTKPDNSKLKQSASETVTHSKQSFTRPKLKLKDNNFEPNLCKQFDDFLQFAGHFHDSNYLLLISKTDATKHEDAIANIPWLCVFDFDTESHKEGLFYRVEDTVSKHRGIYPCTWKDPPNITANGTEWCFISGSTHQPGSKTPDKVKQWYLEVQDDLEIHIKKIASYLDTVMPLTVVMFWPEDTKMDYRFEKVVSHINHHIRPLPQLIVVGNPSSEPSIRIIEDVIEPDYWLKEKTAHVFHDLSTNIGRRHGGSPQDYTLPTDDGSNDPNIDEALAASLREDMQVLYIDNPFRTDWIDLNKPEEDERLFFKGGTLNWQAYYDHGPDHFYESRDLLCPIVHTIQKDFMSQMRSGTIRLYHAPGAGGTTLAQKILWDLHTLTPCVQVMAGSTSSATDVAQKIEIIYQKTHLPVIVLLDGPDHQLYDQLKYNVETSIVVFICLKRVPDKIDTKSFGPHQFLLPGALSASEAKRICPKFRRFCDNDEKRDQLQELLDDVIAGTKHHLIEFGLVTYLHEYTGVSAYVTEYLRLDHKCKELQSFQKVLGYLALVQYFGQTPMPIQLFAKMFGISANKKLTLKQFPSSVQEFIIQVDTGTNRSSVRICHFLIAKEILEQLLSKSQCHGKDQELSNLAKRNLQPFVLAFINDMKARQNEVGFKSRALVEIMFQTFIHRDTWMMDESDQHLYANRPQFSRLLESIPCEQPYTERLQIFEALAESFPDIPSFWAHLGRAFAIYRPTDPAKTEECFQRAFSLFHEDVKLDEQKDENDHVLSCIHHMYGMFYMLQIKAHISKCKRMGHEMQFQEEVRKIQKLATIGCEAFSESRKFSCAGYHESFGCLGEIKVRLGICSFLKAHYTFTTMQGLLEASKNVEIQSFVQESLTLVQHLFVQCHNVVDYDKNDAKIDTQVQRYNKIFKGMVPTILPDNKIVPDTIESRRHKLAAIKVMYGKETHLGTVEDITEEADVKFVIELLEKNLDDSKNIDVIESKKALDNDYLDWLRIIRHSTPWKRYTIEEVLTRVRCWHFLLHSPYSLFYLFTLLTTYGINQNSGCNQGSLKEAISFKEQEEFGNVSKKIHNPRTPREWLAKEHGIKSLQPGKNFHRKTDVDVIDDEAAIHKLLILTGTIKSPNKLRQTGYIHVDIEGNTDIPVKIFFRPFRTEQKLYGTNNAGRRVEFMMAFTPQNGYTAFNVRTLSKSSCKNCDTKLEILSVENYRICKCGEMIENANPAHV